MLLHTDAAWMQTHAELLLLQSDTTQRAQIRAHTFAHAYRGQDLASEEPVQEADRLLALVVGRHGDVDEAEGRVGVAEGQRGDVDEGRLLERLRVRAGVGDDQQPRLLESLLDLVREGTCGAHA